MLFGPSLCWLPNDDESFVLAATAQTKTGSDAHNCGSLSLSLSLGSSASVVGDSLVRAIEFRRVR